MQGAVEVVHRTAEVGVGKGLRAQAEEYFLLGFQNAHARLAYLLDGAQGGVVAAGVHVDFYQVVVHFFAVGRVGKLVQEALKHGDRLGKGRVRRLVDAKRIVVESFFLHGRVEVHRRGLFEGHLCLPFVLQFEETQAHVQVGVLCQGVALAGGASQRVAGTLEGARVEIAHAELVERVAFGLCGRLHVDFQCAQGVVQPSLPVVGAAEDALQLVLVSVSPADGDVAVGRLFGFLVFPLFQVNVGNVVGSFDAVFLIVLQALEHGQGFFVAFLHVVDVGFVEVHVALVFRRADLHHAQQRVGFFEVARFDVCQGQVEGHLVALLVAQQVEVALLEAADGLEVVFPVEVGVGNQGVYAVLIGSVGVCLQVAFQRVDAVFLLELVGRAGNHVFGLAAQEKRRLGGLHILAQGV